MGSLDAGREAEQNTGADRKLHLWERAQSAVSEHSSIVLFSRESVFESLQGTVTEKMLGNSITVSKSLPSGSPTVKKTLDICLTQLSSNFLFIKCLCVCVGFGFL